MGEFHFEIFLGSQRKQHHFITLLPVTLKVLDEATPFIGAENSDKIEPLSNDSDTGYDSSIKENPATNLTTNQTLLTTEFEESTSTNADVNLPHALMENQTNQKSNGANQTLDKPLVVDVDFIIKEIIADVLQKVDEKLLKNETLEI